MSDRTPTAAPDYLTYTEAMGVLRISRSTLLRYVAAGHLTPLRLPNGQPRLRREDVEALLTPSSAA